MLTKLGYFVSLHFGTYLFSAFVDCVIAFVTHLFWQANGWSSSVLITLFFFLFSFQMVADWIGNFSFCFLFKSLVVAQPESVNTVENQPVEDPPSSRFTWRIDNFSRLNTKKLYSEIFIVGGYKWYFAYTFGKMIVLSFLKCTFLCILLFLC